jgi:response regulator NasT
MLRVLIAEDEALLVYSLRRQLEARGCQVVGIAGTGEAAVTLCKSERPEVILMDIRMPQMNGLEATRQIMEECPTCVVMLTANDSDDQVAEAEAAGATAYLVKPVNANQIMPAMEMARRKFEEMVGLHRELHELHETLAASRLIEKAKGLIMQRSGFNEMQALKRLQQLARQKKLPIAIVAKTIASAAGGGEEGE